MKNSYSESYAAAGVDVTAGYESVERIKPMVESTYIPGVMGTLGGFGGMFAPERTITRAEFTVIAMRFAQLEGLQAHQDSVRLRVEE